MKKWIIRFLVIGVVVVVVVVVAVLLSLNTIVKRGVETVGPMIVKVDVKLGSANISPFTGSVQLSGLAVGNPPGYKSPSAIKVGSIKVVADLASALTDTIKVNSIDIQAPEITCEGGLGGINLKEIQKNLASTSDASTAAAAPASSKSAKKFYVKDIVIEGGKISVALNELGGKGLVVPLPPIHLQNIGSETMGVTANELVSQVLEPILSSAIKAALDSAGNLGGVVGEAGKGATEQINKVGKGFKGLFGK